MWVYENVPVSMSARAGIVGKDETTCWSKTTEECANSSRWGVLMNGFPYAPRWSLRNVSATITTTLGRWTVPPPALLASIIAAPPLPSLSTSLVYIACWTLTGQWKVVKGFGED